MIIHHHVEELVQSELKGLCTNCAHSGDCSYFRNSAKAIIQCEMYTLATPDAVPMSGLCKTCEHRGFCKLPGRNTGAWHCNDYK